MDPASEVQTSKILVVDSVPANVGTVEAALAPLARTIITAHSGRDALAQLLTHELALVLLDVQMPDMDGYELARWIRSRERTEHLPIIFMTAQSREASAVLRAYALGAVDFLYRPVPPDVLRAKVSVFVTLHERTGQLANERMQRELDNHRRDFETAALRRERDLEQAAKAELARLNEALAEHDRRKDSFIAILAHELRNPLAPLRTCVDLIQTRPDEPLTSRMIQALDRQTNVLCRLVDDLLDVSRIKADKIELRPEHVDIVDLVDQAIATSRPALDVRRHELVVETPSDRVMVVADTVRLVQVLCNVLNNAARYTQPQGRIEVTVTCDPRFAIVSIRDNGVGIPAELKDSIFNMFVQERVRSDGSGGLGLGLALSRRLIEMHGGSIVAHSDGRNCGSMFQIRVPRVGSPLALVPKKRSREMVPLAPPRAILTILVDDNDDARELIADLLRGRGFDVIVAADGATGLALIQEHQPDIAIIDLGLPKVDGCTIADTLRRESPGMRTRLIALSGYGHASDHERTKSAGFDAHLVKPATAEALFSCISKQLEKAQPS